jgi:hypothetical protein
MDNIKMDLREVGSYAVDSTDMAFGWECLDHAPYSPDLTPSDFHFFPTFEVDTRRAPFHRQ